MSWMQWYRPFIPVLWSQVDLCELEARLVYIANSGPARAI